MSFKLEKLSKGKKNVINRYRFICNTEGVDAIFTRDNFREVLEGLGFSPQRIGHVVKLINKIDPLPVRPKTSPSDLAHYSESFLINYMRKKGFEIYIKIPVSDEDIIFWLESKGFTVFEGQSNEMPSASVDDPQNDSALYIDEESNIHP